MNKVEFCKIINRLKKAAKIIRSLDENFKKMSPDFGGFAVDQYEYTILELLKIIMKDKDDYIGYYIYDLDFGKNWHKGCLTDKSGIDIPLKTPEDLYNIIKDNLYTEKED